jgi:dTDP-4-amino-4,6-dideoxygalactose transaminase
MVVGSVLTASGYIVNRERIELSPRFLGVVKWIGVKKGDAVVTSPLSFVATANAALYCGADVDFEDIDPITGNIEHVSDVGYDWVVPVHFAGRACKISARVEYVIEDASHALGATDFDGCSKIGSCAHSLATCFSFHPVKPITTGEGGAVTTNDEGLRDEMRLLRSHGRDEHGLMRRLGFNYRMTEVAAALGLSQLRRCEEMRERRLNLARAYTERFDEWADETGVPRSGAIPPRTSAWHLLPIRLKGGRRDAIKTYLNEHGIGAQVHYSPIIPLQPYWTRQAENGGEWPYARAWAAEELSLPLHAGMVEADVERVVKTLRESLAPWGTL